MTERDDGRYDHTAGNGLASTAVEVLEGTDWAGLEHAYGTAEDIPPYLVQLLHEDPELRADALGMLDMSVLHQGSVYSATPPVARFVAAILRHPRTSDAHESCYPWDGRTRPLRAALLEWLGLVAESAESAEPAESGEEPGSTDHAETAAGQACRATRPTLYQAVVPFLDDPHPAVREAAVGAATSLLKAPELAGNIPTASRSLRRTLAGSGSGSGTDSERRGRAAAVLALGNWGQDTTVYLTDPDPAVRACAALAEGCATHPGATAVLLEALLDPADADRWFAEPLPQLDCWFRFTLLKAVLKRVDSFEALVPAALALLPFASDYTVDRDWGPLMAKAFPGGYRGGSDLTTSQRDFLRALTEHDACWGSAGNRIRWLRRLGLPERREEIRGLL